MELPDSLLDCLVRETALVSEFSVLLEAETQALVNREAFDQLPGLAQQKEELALRLAALSDHRDSLLARLGLPAGHEGTGQAAAQDARLSVTWQDLLARAAKAHELNDRHSALIEHS